MEDIEEPMEINIYIIEHHKELIARTMLLIAIINRNDINLREKSELFFEIYGNTLIKENTSDYISDMSKMLIRIVTEDYKKAPQQLIELFDFTNLK